MTRKQEKIKKTRHVCPRNCYDTCSIIAHTHDNVVKKVEGDPLQTYTAGKLCTKGYSYINRLYHPDRLKTPLKQTHRGSGVFEKISWDEAMDIISDKILSLYDRYKSHKSLVLNKYSGNFGVLHNAAEGFFNSLGSSSQAIGSPCWSAGLDANVYDFGNYLTSSPEQMAKAKLIILWGVNPAWTAIHSMPYIYQARSQGAEIIVIDPVFTASAKKSTIYFQVKPGSDLYLATALAKIIYEKNLYNHNFIDKHSHGWQDYASLLANYQLEDLAEKCGQKIENIEKLASLMANSSPMTVWTGFGLQRHRYGGQTIRAINALVAMTGNIGIAGGGVQYAHQETWKFNGFTEMLGQKADIRSISINNFTEELNALNDPPAHFLWISCRNLLTQSPARKELYQALGKLDMIVTVDQFMTPTAKFSDLILPTTTQFEEWDIVSSYWHHWIAINQPAITPYHESKSELAIAQTLAKALNKKRPNTSSFPTDLSERDFIEKEFNPDIYHKLEISSWRELLEGPRQYKNPVAWDRLDFDTPSGKFEFYSTEALKDELPATALELNYDYVDKNISYPYWLITPHSQFGLNSQFQNLDLIQKLNEGPFVIIHSNIAREKSLYDSSLAKIHNRLGSFTAKTIISDDIAPDTIVFYQGWYPNSDVYINDLVPGTITDMGKRATGSQGMAFYNTFVNITRL